MAGSAKKKAKGARRGRPGAPARSADGAPAHRWTFLSNHAHVLICLAKDPDVRLRDVARQIGITERAVMKILADLEEEGLVRRYREGRRNTYELSLDRPLRHPIEQHRKVGELVGLILDGRHAPQWVVGLVRNPSPRRAGVTVPDDGRGLCGFGGHVEIARFPRAGRRQLTERHPRGPTPRRPRRAPSRSRAARG